jgi:nucleotide-binding universal stress UspA family protein
VRTILIALSTSRFSEIMVERSFSEATAVREEGGSARIDVVYVLETRELNSVYRSVGETGFLGSQTQQHVLDTLAEELHRTARRRMGQIADRARALEFEVKTLEQEGEYVAVVHELAGSQRYDVIYVTRADRPFISRFLFGSKCEEVARLVRGEGLGEVVIGD